MSLATIERVSIEPHQNADALELANVRGWQCVVRAGEFQTGDLVVYIEIDTWVPHDVAPFLSKGHEPKTYEGIVGERLRTIRLRGELSQGLILPLSVLDTTQWGMDFYEGQDVTKVLGVRKWHAPIPAALAGEFLPWPSEIPKTDQENVQNIYSELNDLLDQPWIVEEKLDGSSCTIYKKKDGTVGICSRNWELKLNEANANNAFILAARRQRLFDAIASFPRRIAIQAELCGPGIQGNIYNLNEPKLFVFDVYWIDDSCYATHHERIGVLNEFKKNIGIEFDRTPSLCTINFLPSLSGMLELSDGYSDLNKNVRREGLVFKTINHHNGKVYSFKVVSNQYLLKQR